PSSTRLRTCGSSCATTGSRTGSSNHTTVLSTIVARPGTSSSISLGASCPPDCANGRTSSDQWDSVYDAVTDRFVTTWAAISVGCEACHGQGSRHVAWARAKHSWWPFNDDPRKGLLVSFDERRDIGWRIDPTTGNARRNFAPATVRKEVETCGRCHARRSEFSEDWVPGRSLSDTHFVAPLAHGLYEADGQMRDEVYNYGSVKQRKMFPARRTSSE